VSGALAFSILERIDVGETLQIWRQPRFAASPFSILERIDVGETRVYPVQQTGAIYPFSILERIDVGETDGRPQPVLLQYCFQYPRTDRRG